MVKISNHEGIRMKNNSTLYLFSTPSSKRHFNNFFFVILAKKNNTYIYIHMH